MEIAQSKGFVLFVLVVLTLTVVNSINTKKFDMRASEEVFISMNK